MNNSIRIAVLSAAAAALASAATYRVSLPTDANLAGQDLKAGDYKIDVNGDTATVKGSGHTVDAKVTTQTTATKNDSTAVKMVQVDGKYTVQSIQIGGKAITLVFDSAKTTNGGL